MSGERAITVVSRRPLLGRRLLAGGIAGADVGLFATILAAGFVSVDGAILLTLIPATVVAGVAALGAYIVQRHRSPLRHLNRDLTGIISLLERGLIDEEEYQQLKVRLIDNFQPQKKTDSSIIKAALWGALAGSFLPLLAAGFTAAIYVALPAMLLPAVGGAVATAGVTEISYRLGQRKAPQLSSGELPGWEKLGTRRPLSLDE